MAGINHDRDLLNNEREIIAIEARRYASHYPEGSDGRNTFILLAEWIEGRFQTLQNTPMALSDAEWLRRLADAYQPISNDQSDGEKSERLRRIARELTDQYPTPEAYERACAAIEKHRERADRFQRERAELYDKLNGTPCAEIRWQQDREKSGEYAVKLQRIIESICRGHGLDPASANLHHHKMAAAYLSDRAWKDGSSTKE